MTSNQIDWTVDQPAVIYIREMVGKLIPEIGLWHDATLSDYGRLHVRDHPKRGVGGRVDRTTASGGFSRHSEGRAADIYVDVRNPLLKKIGDKLFEGFANYAREIGLEDLIWNDKQWSQGNPVIHGYSKVDHRNHLHVGFSRAGSQQQNMIISHIIASARIP